MLITLNKFWIAAGIPTTKISLIIFQSQWNDNSEISINVCFLLSIIKTIKYKQAIQLDINVAIPAPATPIFKYCGNTKNGSNIIFKKHPLIVPILACSEAPSERTK